MKIFFVVLNIAGLHCLQRFGLALDPAQDKTGEPKIKCCFPDGQCLETRKENCALKQGICCSRLQGL